MFYSGSDIEKLQQFVGGIEARISTIRPKMKKIRKAMGEEKLQ